MGKSTSFGAGLTTQGQGNPGQEANLQTANTQPNDQGLPKTKAELDAYVDDMFNRRMQSLTDRQAKRMNSMVQTKLSEVDGLIARLKDAGHEVPPDKVNAMKVKALSELKDPKRKPEDQEEEDGEEDLFPAPKQKLPAQSKSVTTPTDPQQAANQALAEIDNLLNSLGINWETQFTDEEKEELNAITDPAEFVQKSKAAIKRVLKEDSPTKEQPLPNTFQGGGANPLEKIVDPDALYALADAERKKKGA